MLVMAQTPSNDWKTAFGTHGACYLQHLRTWKAAFGTHGARYLQHICSDKTAFGTHGACYLCWKNNVRHPWCLLFTLGTAGLAIQDAYAIDYHSSALTRQ